MRSKTPQQKKKLSLEKYRRNTYGEPRDASSKSIPLRKKLRNRANRHMQEAQLPSVPVQLDADEADRIESAMRHKPPQAWEKYPDKPLGEVIELRRRNRQILVGRRGRSA